MKKFLLAMGFALALFGCDEANDVFDYDDYWAVSYGKPVYLDVTSWGAAAYVDDEYVNRGVKLLISQNEDAEGGMEYDVTSNVIKVNDLSLNTLYYYCLKISGTEIKSEIESTLTEDVSALSMEFVEENDSLYCVLGDTVNPVFIIEKGFKIEHYGNTLKYPIEVEQNFSVSKADLKEEFSLVGQMNVYAYMQTSNAYYKSFSMDIAFGNSSGINGINSSDIVFSEITELTLDDKIDYLACTITGYTDSVYFRCRDWHWAEKEVSPTKFDVNKDGSVTYYLKKDFYYNVEVIADYRMYYEWDNTSYGNFTSNSNIYYVTEFTIASLDDFLKFAQLDIYNTCTIHLKSDITIPSGTRISLDLSDMTFEGNGHTIDGISYFPFIRSSWGATVNKLKIGTDKSVYYVEKGTNSMSTTNNDVPMYFLKENTEGTFVDCEIRGTILVFNRDDFYVSPEYHNYYVEDEVSTDAKCVEIISGLKDYTAIEFKTTD